MLILSVTLDFFLFFQVFKGEFQLPDFLKEVPQVQYWISFLFVGVVSNKYVTSLYTPSAS